MASKPPANPTGPGISISRSIMLWFKTSGTPPPKSCDWNPCFFRRKRTTVLGTLKDFGDRHGHQIILTHEHSSRWCKGTLLTTGFPGPILRGYQKSIQSSPFLFIPGWWLQPGYSITFHTGWLSPVTVMDVMGSERCLNSQWLRGGSGPMTWIRGYVAHGSFSSPK